MRYAATKSRAERTRVLNEFCETSRYHRKYAIHLLNQPDEGGEGKPRRRRGVTYSAMALRVLEAIWRAAGYPWSERLKGLLALWLPWARGRFPGLTPDVERQLLAISARQIDPRLRPATEGTATRSDPSNVASMDERSRARTRALVRARSCDGRFP